MRIHTGRWLYLAVYGFSIFCMRLISQHCASCGRPGVQLRRVTRSFGSGKLLLVIESIPMWSCPHCGESYFTAQTLHEVERIKALRKSVAVDREVSVAEFYA